MNSKSLVIGIDPGHGMSSKTPGVFDSGCEGPAGVPHEANIALTWALTLKAELVSRGYRTFMTRPDDSTPSPLGTRAQRAVSAGCDVLLSIHVDSTDGATGTTGLYANEKGRKFIEKVCEAQSKITGLRNRGPKDQSTTRHGKLAILRRSDSMVCGLIELGFIERDHKALLSRDNRIAFADAVADILDGMN